MPRYILIKPIISEKSDKLSDKLRKYTFMVDKKANKVEIRKAIEEMYSVNVESVNTAMMPGKAKTRYSKTGVMKGRKPSFKKAVVSLAEGENIDFFGEA
jgi:large subunit ribosomal protein L23